MDAKAQSFDHEMDFGIKIYNKTFVYLIKRFYLYIINNRHMKAGTFKQVSQNEVKFTFKGMNFILEEKKVGVYGLGRCVNLYQLEGVSKAFVKTIGWTQTDNHSGPSIECITSNIISFITCRQLAVDYLEKLLS
jgi:hypothetical protein